MSKYTTTKNEYSMDVMRVSDNHACGFMCSNVWFEPDEIYRDAEIVDGKTIRPADTLPDGKKFGDVKTAGRGWLQEDYNWDTELQNTFGEVDADLKKELTDYFTTDLKAKYLTSQKGS